MLARSFSHPHDLSPPRMTSLVITPSMRSQQPQQPSSPNRPGRPRLSLNTASLSTQTRTFGKGSSLRLETLSAVSPTVINTFANAYEPEKTPAEVTGRPTRPKLSIDSSVPNQIPPSDDAEAQDSRTPSSSSVSSASSTSTLDSATIPYSMSQVLNSILSNSPLQPRITPRRMSSRPMFRAEKKVSFRTPLVEEISNTKYTLASSDLEISDLSDTGSSISLSSDDTESQQASSLSSSQGETESSQEIVIPTLFTTSDTPLSHSPTTTSPKHHRRGHRLTHRTKSKTKYPRAGDKRDSSSESDSDSDRCPETPVAGRRKRRREWVWTLGPNPSEDSTKSTSTDDVSTTTTSTFNSSSLESIASSHESS